METQKARLQGEEFIISRVFDAPRELVFDAWTQERHLKEWFGPEGCAIVETKLDFRPGGFFHYGMSFMNGQVMYGKWIFKEIRRPERLVLISQFSDAKGGLSRHPGSPDWPRETLSTTTFEDAGGKTLLTLLWTPYQASEVERQTFLAAASSMEQGWSGTFRQLDAYLAKAGK
ncbi:MAG TPA: SRPBCC domain-containing protein [Gammaproteobacteria bacterium]|jgi:uncharacterized protein YndB with AHSA1/START domain